MAAKINFFTGCYSRAMGDVKGNGAGICRVTLNLQSGELSNPECIAPCINPSYLAWGPEKKTLYATREVVRPDTAAILSFATTGNLLLKPLNTVDLQGESPCHLSVDPTGRLLASAQYGSGDIAVFKLNNDGSIGRQCSHIQHTGQGLSATRQEGPHAHCVDFLSGKLVAVDLGTDSVLGYTINPNDNTVSNLPNQTLNTQPGTGPRHITALGSTGTAYVLCELSEEICQVVLHNNTWRVVDTVPAFRNQRPASGAAAAIKLSPDHRHLYASGRHQSVIACFAIDETTGRLSAVDQFDTGGRWPRDFSLSPDGDYLIVANQHTDNLVCLKRDSVSGCLATTGCSVDSGSPVCVLF